MVPLKATPAVIIQLLTKATAISKNGLALFRQMLVVLLHRKRGREKGKGENMQSLSQQSAVDNNSIYQVPLFPHVSISHFLYFVGGTLYFALNERVNQAGSLKPQR
jgi:hypothetical protein